MRAAKGMIVRPWTVPEERALRHLAHLGDAHLSLALERSRASIRTKAHRLGVSVRKDASAPHDAALLVQIVRCDGALCPACAKRLAAVAATGLCEVCHYRRLEQAHADALAAVEARRGYDAARQRVCRARSDG